MKLIKYQTKYCKNNNNEESKKDIAQCIYSKDNKIGYELFSVKHIMLYINILIHMK